MEHEAQTLLFELFAIFLVAKVIGEIFERFKLPAVLGEILAGAAIGPYALGWIHPGSFTIIVAEIGAIFVLFSAGLETSPGSDPGGTKGAAGGRRRNIVPFALGFGYMKWRGERPLKRFSWARPWWPPAWESPRACWATCGCWRRAPPRSSSARPSSMTFWGWCCWRSWPAWLRAAGWSGCIWAFWSPRQRPSRCS